MQRPNDPQSPAATACVALPVVARAERVFSLIGVSTTDKMKRQIITSDTVTINGVEAKTGFTTLARSGDAIDGVTFSQLTDQNGNPVVGESDQDKASSAADTRAYVGYVGPFPVTK